HDPRGNLPRESPKIQIGPDDVLDGKSQVLEIQVARDRNGFKMFQQAAAVVPRSAAAVLHDVVPFECADREVAYVADFEAPGEVVELIANNAKDVLAEVDQVHLVDGHRQVRDP